MCGYAVIGDPSHDGPGRHDKPALKIVVIPHKGIFQDSPDLHLPLRHLCTVKIVKGNPISHRELPSVDLFHVTVVRHQYLTAVRELVVIHTPLLQIVSDVFSLLLGQRVYEIIVVILILLGKIINHAEAPLLLHLCHPIQRADLSDQLLIYRGFRLQAGESVFVQLYGGGAVPDVKFRVLNIPLPGVPLPVIG